MLLYIDTVSIRDGFRRELGSTGLVPRRECARLDWKGGIREVILGNIGIGECYWVGWGWGGWRRVLAKRVEICGGLEEDEVRCCGSEELGSYGFCLEGIETVDSGPNRD